VPIAGGLAEEQAMYRTLLVPLDGSTFAEHALPAALAVARHARSRLHLVSVITPLAEAYVEGLYISTGELEAQLDTRQRGYLEGVARRLRERTDVPITVAVPHGEVADTLCRLQAEEKAELVVMATHGRGALGRFWLGSVADEMLRHTTTPLLLIRPGHEAPDLAHEPELGKVVLPLDGSPLAEQILEPAVTLAGLMPDARVTLIRAIHPVLPPIYPVDVPGEREAQHLAEQVEAMQGRLQGEAQRYLDAIAERLRGRGLTVQTEVIIEEQPAPAILHEADKVKAGLIALQTHGRRGLARLILGSVADKVIRGAHVPVLVHRPVKH
jgi:nucleotide-binding universal stress UspA family protein